MNLPRVGIIVLNWNGWAHTLECLESLRRLDYPHFRIIVCDNGSSDGSLDRIRDWAAGRSDWRIPSRAAGIPDGQAVLPLPLVHVLHDRRRAEQGGGPDDAGCRLVLLDTGANLGFAGGNNVGLRYLLARSDLDYAWILNNDTVVDPAALAEMVAAVSADPHDRPLGSRIYYYDEPQRLQVHGGQTLGRCGVVAPRYTGDPARVEYLMGASLFLSRRRLQLLGLINEDYFLNAEDLEYTYFYAREFARAHPGVAPFLVAGRIWHKESATQGRNVFMHAYYFTRNVLYVARRIGRGSQALTMAYAWLRVLPALLRGRLAHARGIVAGIRDFRRGRTGAYRADA